jgi:hypothetical protein
MILSLLKSRANKTPKPNPMAAIWCLMLGFKRNRTPSTLRLITGGSPPRHATLARPAPLHSLGGQGSNPRPPRLTNVPFFFYRFVSFRFLCLAPKNPLEMVGGAKQSECRRAYAYMSTKGAGCCICGGRHSRDDHSAKTTDCHSAAKTVATC